MRSLSETSQTSSKGTGGGPSGNAIAAPSGGGQSYLSLVEQQNEDLLKSFFEPGPDINFGGSEGFPVPVQTIIQFFENIASFFDFLFGGGGSPPIPRQLTHARHPLYPVILGVSGGLIPTEASEADSSVLMVQATRGNPGDDRDLGLEGKALDAEIRRLSELARSKPSGHERQKLQRKINELRARKSKKAHGADKFSWIPIVPEPPLAADSSDLPETLDILIEVLEFAL